MKAASLWQLWAGLMEVGAKRNETRSWSTSYRGDLAICSAKKVVPIPADLLAEVMCDPKAYPILTHLKYGFVLCVVRLFDVVPTEKKLWDLTDREAMREWHYGDYSPGRFIWKTDDLRPLKTPVPVIGRQGLFNLPTDVEAKVREQLYPQPFVPAFEQ